MEVIQLPVVRYRMGAEELIELGRGRRSMGAPRSPFFSNRPRMTLGSCGHAVRAGSDARMGDTLDIAKGIANDIGGMITDALGFALATLGDLVSMPLDFLSKRADITLGAVANLLDHAPIIGGLLAQILLLGNAVIRFSLPVPGMLLHGLGNILTGISGALFQKATPAQNQESVDKAKDDIVKTAPPGIKDQVLQALDSTGVTGTNLTPALEFAARGE